jgi:hypothetical protein
MKKVNLLFAGLLFTVLQGCMDSSTAKPPYNENEITQKVGIGLEKGEIQKLPVSPRGLYYYGQIVIEPKLTQHALKGPEAQTFLSHVGGLLGEKRKNFGLSVTPIIDNQRLLPIVLFNYAYDSTKKEWSTSFNEEPRTRMTLLKADTELAFEFNYISIDNTQFEAIKKLTKDIYGGSVILAGTPIPYLDLLSEKITNIMSHSTSSSTTLYFRPVSDRKKSVQYTVKTKANNTLAKVNFRLLLRDSVVSGATVDSQLNQIPQGHTFSNPLNEVYTNRTNAFTLYDQLQKDESIANFSQINEPSQFRNKCRDIINRLETYGLNIFDRYNAFSQILEHTNFLRKEALFNSGCLSPSKLNLLTQMGIPLKGPKTPYQHIEISDTHLKNLGSYMLNPIANRGFKADLEKLFAETLIIQSDELIDFVKFRSEEGEAIMSPEAFLKHLGKIGIARFGNYNENRKEYARFYFRPLRTETIYRIKLNREKQWGRIRTVQIQPVSNDNIALSKQRELRRVADNTVLGYENDIMRNITLALNN